MNLRFIINQNAICFVAAILNFICADSCCEVWNLEISETSCSSKEITRSLYYCRQAIGFQVFYHWFSKFPAIPDPENFTKLAVFKIASIKQTYLP